MAVSLTETDITHALHSHHTVLYFHGNAASRAAPHRVRFYSQWTSRVKANVLAIDYRGFADSEGTPSEEGLGIDGRAAWNWLTGRGARPNDILLFGQSLGTAVVAKVAHELSLEGERSLSPYCVTLDHFQVSSRGGPPCLGPLLTWRLYWKHTI